MRVYELADELDISSTDLIEILDQQYGQNVNSHMNNVEDDIASDVRELINSNSTKQSQDLQINEIVSKETVSSVNNSLKSAISEVFTSVSFGIGLSVLLIPNEDHETHKEIRDEIRDLGSEYTDPVKQQTEDVVDQVTDIPLKMNDWVNDVYKTSRTQLTNLTKNFLDTVVNDAIFLIKEERERLFSANGESKLSEQKRS